MTIIETLQNANDLINNGTMVGVGNAQKQLKTAVALIEKGYLPEDEVEPLLKEYGELAKVPKKGGDKSSETARITNDGIEVDMNLEEIQACLNELEVKFQPNTGIKKLAAMLQKALGEVDDDEGNENKFISGIKNFFKGKDKDETE